MQNVYIIFPKLCNTLSDIAFTILHQQQADIDHAACYWLLNYVKVRTETT